METLAKLILIAALCIAAVAVSRRMDRRPYPRFDSRGIVALLLLALIGDALRFAWRELTVALLAWRIGRRARKLVAERAERERREGIR
jgi:hypothetical protein